MNEAERGLLPAEATIVVGQPLTLDPSRAPEGRGLLWIQLQELPWRIKGDAAGGLDVGSGEWTDELRERYADRIQARLARHIPNLESSILKRVALGPHDLQRANVNLRHGDPYGGSLALDQNFLWRPFGGSPGPHDAGRAAVADRREHLARPRPRRRLGDDRRAEAARAAAHAARAGRARGFVQPLVRLVAHELEGGAVQPGDRELVALGEVDLDHLDVVAARAPGRTVGEPAFITTFPARASRR